MRPVVLPDLAVPLAPLTTLRLGGPARRLVEAESADEVVDGPARATSRLVMGGGSNLVIADAGWPGTVVRISSRGRRVERRPDGSVLLTVEAGEEWDDVVAATVADGLGGLECLSGIPGSHGRDAGAERRRVRGGGRRRAGRRRAARPDGGGALGPGRRARIRLPHKRAQGPLRRGRAAGADRAARRRPQRAAALRRARQGARRGAGERVPAAVAREAVLALRRGKGMVLDAADHDTWSAGSFFTNPVLAAAPPGAPTLAGRATGSRCPRPG